MNILVTGGAGQLAQCLKDVSKSYQGFNFIYTDIEELDITDIDAVNSFFEQNNLAFCINCAAYTAVDKAESELDIAKKINKEAAGNLAITCNKNKVRLIHISTDFVFDGAQSVPYNESVEPRPLNVYGTTKLSGEVLITDNLDEHWIIRTSWLYSEYGNNFLKTMLRLGSEREELSVVFDQIGSPTYAKDLAKVILKIISGGHAAFGIYHFSNEGVASWYDFAKAIFDETNTKCKLQAIKTESYPTPAMRPSFSVMDKTKIKESLNIQIPYWRDSLRKCLGNRNVFNPKGDL